MIDIESLIFNSVKQSYIENKNILKESTLKFSKLRIKNIRDSKSKKPKKKH